MSERGLPTLSIITPKKVKNNNILFAISILGFVLIYLLRDVVGIPVPKTIFTVYCAVAFLSMSIERSFAFYALTLALTLPSNQITAVYLIVIFLKLLIQHKILIDISKLVIISLMLMIQALDQAVFGTSSMYSSIYLFVQIALFTLVPLVWVTMKLDSVSVQKAMICFVFGFIIGSFVVLYITARETGLQSLFTGGYRLSMNYMEHATSNSDMVTTYNANALASIASLSISFILVLLHQKKIHIATSMIMLFYSLLICVMTLSRTGIVTLIFIVFYYFLFCHSERKTKKSKATILLVVGICISICLAMFPHVFDSIYSRFIVDDITNGRLSINSAYTNEWLNNIWCFFWGYGSITYQNITNITYSPHNMIVDILISWGIVGLFLVIAWLFLVIRQRIYSVDRKNIMLALLPTLTYLLALQTGQFLTVITSYLLLNFAVIAVSGVSATGEVPC